MEAGDDGRALAEGEPTCSHLVEEEEEEEEGEREE